MSDEICIGPCNARYRREQDAYERDLRAYHEAVEAWENGESGDDPYPEAPAPPRLAPWYGAPVWCSSCGYDIKAKLSRLDGLACLYLRDADGHRGAGDQARVGGSHTTPSLSPALDDLDELDGWLRDWRATCMGTDTMARQGDLAHSITLGTAWLVARTERILARAAVARLFGDEIHIWHRRLARVSKSDVVVHLKPLRCDKCHRLTLEWKDGDDKVTCRARDCMRVLKLDEYDALAEHETKALASR